MWNLSGVRHYVNFEDNIDNRGILIGEPTVGVVLEVNVDEETFEELVEKFEPLIKKQIQQRYQTSHDPEVVENIPAPVDQTQVTFPIAELLPLLSKSERIWLSEFYYSGKGPMAIASQYGVSVDTVKTWRKRAIRKLQSILTVNQVVEMIGN